MAILLKTITLFNINYNPFQPQLDPLHCPPQPQHPPAHPEPQPEQPLHPPHPPHPLQPPEQEPVQEPEQEPVQEPVQVLLHPWHKPEQLEAQPLLVPTNARLA